MESELKEAIILKDQYYVQLNMKKKDLIDNNNKLVDRISQLDNGLQQVENTQAQLYSETQQVVTIKKSMYTESMHESHYQH